MSGTTSATPKAEDRRCCDCPWLVWVEPFNIWQEWMRHQDAVGIRTWLDRFPCCIHHMQSSTCLYWHRYFGLLQWVPQLFENSLPIKNALKICMNMSDMTNESQLSPAFLFGLHFHRIGLALQNRNDTMTMTFDRKLAHERSSSVDSTSVPVSRPFK